MLVILRGGKCVLSVWKRNMGSETKFKLAAIFFFNFVVSLTNVRVLASSHGMTDKLHIGSVDLKEADLDKNGPSVPYGPPWIVTKATEALRKTALCMLNDADDNSLLGLAIAAGQLEHSLEQLKSSTSEESIKIARNLEETIVILDNVREELERREQIPFQRKRLKGLRILDKDFWNFSVPRKQLTVTEQCDLFSGSENYNEFLTEKTTDTCLLAVTQQRIGECEFSSDCWNVMVENMECRGYSGTHQLLFMIASWRMQCGRSFLPSLDYLMTNCSNEIFSHFCAIQNNNFPIESQDIFLEYVTMGGLAGFHDFLQEETFSHVLRWQNQDGCFYVKNSKSSSKKAKALAIHKTAIASAFFGVYASHLALI